MEIYVVKPGDTLYQIARAHGLPMARLIEDNQPPNPSVLVVGQTLVLSTPEITRTVKQGETLDSIAREENTSPRRLLRDNPALSGRVPLFPGQQLVISHQGEKEGEITVCASISPGVSPALLTDALPYLTCAGAVSFRFTSDGALLSQGEGPDLTQLKRGGVTPHLRVCNDESRAVQESDVVHALLSSPGARSRLVEQITTQTLELGLGGVDLDIQAVPDGDGEVFVRLVEELRARLFSQGIPLSVALPPKIDPRAYTGYDYGGLARAADVLILMTNRWRTGSQPPMPTAPMPPLEQAMAYALSFISPQKLLLGIPCHGNDWLLPYLPDRPPIEISNPQAVDLAARYYAAIQYHDRYQTPWFRYIDGNGQEHEVWFEDARSIQAKLALAARYGLLGVSYRGLLHPFPQNWRLLNSMFEIHNNL